MAKWNNPIRIELGPDLPVQIQDWIYDTVNRGYEIDIDKNRLFEIINNAHNEWHRGYQQGQHDAHKHFHKHSHWVHMSDADGDYWECHECGGILPRYGDKPTYDNPYPKLTSIDPTRFCPACGADMLK